jgi:hypothetical protein
MRKLNALDGRWVTSAERETLTAEANIAMPAGDGIGQRVVAEDVKLLKPRLTPSAPTAPREERPATEPSPLAERASQRNVVCSAMGKSSASHCRQPILISQTDVDQRVSQWIWTSSSWTWCPLATSTPAPFPQLLAALSPSSSMQNSPSTG